jgi:hypothetical protein
VTGCLMSDDKLTIQGPQPGTRCALEDVQRTIGDFFSITFDVLESADVVPAAERLFPTLDPLYKAARPAAEGERVLSADETRKWFGGMLIARLEEHGFESESD